MEGGGVKEQLVKNKSTCWEDFWPMGPGGSIKGGMSRAKLLAVTFRFYGPASEAADWPVLHPAGEERVSGERARERSCCSNTAGDSHSHISVFQQLEK